MELWFLFFLFFREATFLLSLEMVSTLQSGCFFSESATWLNSYKK